MKLHSRLCALAAPALAAIALFGAFGAATAASLANQPVFATTNVPGNLALVLSVEFPTASRIAHVADYTSSRRFLGYFDPEKCYTYSQNTTAVTSPGGTAIPAGRGDASYFQPAGLASNRTCNGRWSGNFLNWATLTAIDPFRWAMTGGRRVVDTVVGGVGTTIIEKGWHSNQGYFPERSQTSANTNPGRLPLDQVPGATPFANATTLSVQINDFGYAMKIVGSAGQGTNKVDLAQSYTIRVKVCDTSAGSGGVEANCVRYADNNWKPEGLIQEYAQKMRFSAFGYMNETGNARDGGVMRARQKFVGPVQPVPGQAVAANLLKEWDETTGIIRRNPDAGDAAITSAWAGLTTSSNAIADSGVMNYLNGFGQILPGNYKGNDPVNELYYAALRYFRGLGNMDQWSDLGTATTATKKTRLDGFPVIRDWGDPIQYSCQRNFVLGIGDIYTHADKNVPGNTLNDGEPAMPTFNDMFDAVRSTNNAKLLQGMGADKATAATGSSYSTDYMAGLAFEANTLDIRPDNPSIPQSIGKQSVQTYWVDVLENPFVTNNKFYLAAKFGGLNQSKLPAGFDPYTWAGTIPLDWWSTSGPSENLAPGVPRPDNYFTAGSPDTMVSGLTRAFKDIANAIKAFTTSFSLSSVQASSLGTASYASQYDSNGWTGTISASRITFDSEGVPTSTAVWNTGGAFTTQLEGAGWNTGRNVVTWNGTAGVAFRADGVNSTQLGGLDTPWATGDDSANYLQYLRGDRSNERTSDSDSTKPYRHRNGLLGDIVNAKVTPVGPPAGGYSDSVNPGYTAFKTAQASRPVMVYAGANDGMLHAFKGGLTGAGAGTEQFAYVPSALFAGPSSTPALNGLAQLGNPDYEHRNYVDATPQPFDIDFANAGGAFTTTNAATSDWRTVLIGGLGKGGKSFYAIDITNPASMTTEDTVKGKVLWEFTDPTMGFSFGPPLVVKTHRYGWVVVLTSGYNNSDAYSYIYIVDPRDGTLIQKVQTGAASAGLVQATAYIQDFSDGTTDAVYAGDLNGQLWRFDLTAPRTATGFYPAPLKLATATDAGGVAQPITAKPLVDVDPLTRKRYVMFGTGQLLDTVDINSSQSQAFYAIVDGNSSRFGLAADLPTGVSYPITRSGLTAITHNDLVGTTAIDFAGKAGWRLDLGTNGAGSTLIGWRVVNSPTSFNGMVAFSTLLTTGNACSPAGQSRVYAINFGKGKSALTSADAAQGFTEHEHAITDLKFISVDGTPRLITGDVKGTITPQPISPGGGDIKGLLNWREIPTVD